MGEHLIKMPDVGEGIAEAELVEWHVKVGDLVREDAVLAAVMTDKATGNSPVDGEVLWLGADIGDVVAIGSPLIRLKVEGKAPSHRGREGRRGAGEAPRAAGGRRARSAGQAHDATPPPSSSKPRTDRASPHRRMRPRGRQADRIAGDTPQGAAGIDLRQVPGTGPGGAHQRMRISTPSLRTGCRWHGSGPSPKTSVEQIVVGLRRRIAEKMSIAKSRIPHITYVEEVDVTRAGGPARSLRTSAPTGRSSPSCRSSCARWSRRSRAAPTECALRRRSRHRAPACGHPYRHRDADRVGPRGARGQACGGARPLGLRRRAEPPRGGRESRHGDARGAGGSTITITSLGAMGGIATTPVINHPRSPSSGSTR